MIPVDERWWREYRSIDDVVVYEVDVSEDDRREALAAHILDEEEWERSQRFVFPGPRRRFALCRSALRSILCLRIGCSNDDLKLGATDQEKPYAIVRNEPIEFGFNVSHSGDYGLIAIGEAPALGVDVEFRRHHPNLDLLVSTVLSPDEKAQIASVNDLGEKNNLFFDFWTVKEAVLKAVGVGMSGPEPSEIEVPREMREGSRSCITQFRQISARNWRLVNLGTSKFAAALAYMVD
ncbi:MAG: 4'-phosphopantetheinyl transferase superfamily protein [Chloroflexi bacterium]|nr:4'-phosphopantetheinyl transferase superfamily protein [Chloroflexota bacterium]MYK62310.1 4'-phosphopantetheinyl transferase superfamily protein [Chloroflexota bacterium]